MLELCTAAGGWTPLPENLYPHALLITQEYITSGAHAAVLLYSLAVEVEGGPRVLPLARVGYRDALAVRAAVQRGEHLLTAASVPLAVAVRQQLLALGLAAADAPLAFSGAVELFEVHAQPAYRLPFTV